MELPIITTEGVHTEPVIDQSVDIGPLYYDLESANQPLNPQQQLVFDRAGGELQHAYETRLHAGLSGRRTVAYHVLNNDQAGTERDCLFLTGWGQGVSDPFTRRSVKRLAAIHPETRWVIPTAPGLDGTDRLPQTVLRSLRKGSFIEVGEYMLTALRPAFNQENPLDVYGYSKGGSEGMGIGAASQQGEVRDIRVIDPAAMQRRSVVGMLIAAQVSEAHARQVRERTDSGSFAVYDMVSETGVKPQHIFWNEIDTFFDAYKRVAAMGRAALWSDAGLALDKISGGITAIIGERSEFNTLSRVQTALAHNAFRGDKLFRIGVFNGFHSSIVTNAGSLATLA